MRPSTEAPAPDFFAVLRDVVERMRAASGADIVSLYPFDADTRTYFAPCALGIPEEGLIGSIPDMQDQLLRYLADADQGKAPSPEELGPQQYGPNVWLTITRRVLIARDAVREIGSSFVRRHHIATIVGVPLVAGDTLVGLLYLNYRADEGTADRGSGDTDGVGEPSDERVAELQRQAGLAALAIDRAGRADERLAFVTAGRLAGLLAAPSEGGDGIAREFRGQLSDALRLLLEVARFDAAAAYRVGTQAGRFELSADHGLGDAPSILDPPDGAADGDVSALQDAEQVRRILQRTGMHASLTLPLLAAGQLRGALLLFSQDPRALDRKTPATTTLLGAAADMLAGALASQQLIAAKEDTNRLLGALSRTGGVLVRPGASRQQVLEALVQHLTDEAVPDFSFHFATVFLLGRGERDSTVVQRSAGASVDENIDATPLVRENGHSASPRGVPRWAQLDERVLAPSDVLVYAAEQWRVVVLGAADGDDEVLSGYAPDQFEARDVPAIRANGTTSGLAHAILLRDGAATLSPRAAANPSAPPFTLDGDIFEGSRHRDLVRVFVPFGLDPHARATGVLEAGYHRSKRRRLDRMQVDALRACASQVAVAVETARMYEDVQRHAEHLEIVTDVSAAIASSIDLDQTLRLIARNMARTVDASLCQIALYEDDGSAWYGAAASDQEELWRRQRLERPEPSILFEVLDRRAPVVAEDAQQSDVVNAYYARLFGIQSLLALPLLVEDRAIGAVILGQRDRRRSFTNDEVQRAMGLGRQAAIAIQNARVHALEEEERHIQRDVVLVGFGQWGQKAYGHLLTLKHFFNFKTHVVERDAEGQRERLGPLVQRVLDNGDAIYWDSPTLPAREQLRRELESSCYVITYIATPAATHLPTLNQYYDLSNVVIIEKPLGAAPEAYRDFLSSVDGSVELVAADHYYFKLEVRLLQLLLTEEKTLKSFLDSVEEIEMELLEEKSLTGAAADIGIIADMMPHAFAIISLFTPIDRIDFTVEPLVVRGAPLLSLARQEPLQGGKETYARLTTTFPHRGRDVRLVIDVGKGVENAKWIKLNAEMRTGGRRAFYKFDFNQGTAIDGTQTNLNAAIRYIRQPGVPDNAHLTMLRHAIERKHPAVGILAIREAMRSNQRIQELEALAADLLSKGAWTPYIQGQRPELAAARAVVSLDAARTADGSASRAG